MTSTLSLKNRALRLLARREHSYVELKNKLLPHGSQEEIETLLHQLQEKNWLSDERFAETWIKQRGAKYGRQRLQHELRQKGLSAELIEQSLSLHLEDELTQARRIWERKYGHPAHTPQEKAKQIRFLQYRGYSWDIIRQIVGGNIIEDVEFSD